MLLLRCCCSAAAACRRRRRRRRCCCCCCCCSGNVAPGRYECGRVSTCRRFEWCHSPSTMGWADAKSACEANGMKMIEPRTAEKVWRDRAEISPRCSGLGRTPRHAISRPDLGGISAAYLGDISAAYLGGISRRHPGVSRRGISARPRRGLRVAGERPRCQGDEQLRVDRSEVPVGVRGV